MANIPSQIKRNRQDRTRRARNQAVRSEVKTRTKAALAAAESGDREAAEAAFRKAQQRIDSAAAKGVLHRRTAARKKARLARRVDSLTR